MTRRCLLRGARFSCTYGIFASHGRGVRCRPRAAERRDAPKDSERMPSSHRRQAQRSNRTDCLLPRRSTPSKIHASHAPAAPDTSPTPNRRKQKASPTVFEGYLFCQSIRSILFLLISAKRRQRGPNRTRIGSMSDPYGKLYAAKYVCIDHNARSEKRQHDPNRTRIGSMSVLYGKITVCCQICVHRPQCPFRTERLPAPEDNNQKRRGLQLATRVRV